ncbi:MAG TPA: hypothetical protein VHQ65_00885 [Thermoanaerobaculia bacterium]|nr:hypothetical protein [Thermoanaerobaculia bacterium]
MKSWSLFCAAAVAVLALACGETSESSDGVENQIQAEVEEAQVDARSSDAAVAGAPVVSERYQRSINRGWQEAVAGESPAYACAGLKGRVMGTGETADAEALEALFACNVLLPVRYFETYLEQVEAGEKTCVDLVREMATQLSAMTLSVESIQGMADAMADSPEAGAAETLVAVLDGATLEQGLTDPERLIKDRLEDRVRAVCPDLADVILR